jgi:N-acetylmuramoyl-L-alanine amidase
MDYLIRDVMDYIEKLQGVVASIFLLVALVLILSAPVEASSSAVEAFQSANLASVDLYRDVDKKKDRVSWMVAIHKYLSVSNEFPRTGFAPKARYKAAKLYEDLYRFSSKPKDLQRAADTYLGVADRYPSSSLSDDALYHAAQIYNYKLSSKQKAYLLYQRIISDFAGGDMVQLAREQLNALNLEKRSVMGASKPQLGQVKMVRQWSDKDYTRVVIDLEKDVSFATFTLPADIKAGRPDRVVIELSHAKVTPEVSGKTQVDDGILTDIRVSQYKNDKVRVVLDLAQKFSYRAFPLEGPSRLVVDINRDTSDSQAEASVTTQESPAVTPDQEKKDALYPESGNGIKNVPKGPKSQMGDDVPSIAAQLSLKVSRIVVDAGHGGKDPGAIGPSGILEKDLTLAIARQLSRRLKLEGFDVYQTRDSDVFIPLEERTAFANKNKADLFVSIHINSHNDQSVTGIETYFLNLTTDSSAIEVAARENATTSKSISDLQLIINDLMLNSKINESSRFASCIHKCIMSSAVNTGYRGRDLGVKQAPFYVLLGAQMPSILVELGFITNPTDSSLLLRDAYQSTLIDGIAKGINKYIMNTTYAYFRRKK